MDVICHRACPVGAPENSLPAARALPSHVDMIEIDVQRCGSGELVVFHDRVIDRLTNETGTIAGTDWETLREIPLEDTEATIPRLESLIDAVPPEIGLNIELKHAGMAGDLRPLHEGVENEILVSSFVPQAIEPLAETGFQTAHLIDPNRSVGWEPELAAAESIGADAVHPQYEIVSENRIASAHDRGLSVNAWTVTDSATVETLRTAGVDGVIVDDWRVVESA
jgi:glycerophosphoryl diester phosphodiesterase